MSLNIWHSLSPVISAHSGRPYSCDGSALPRIPPSSPRSYDHERIASFCARSATIGPEYESYEDEWAASEVGEGVEEIWDRSVSLVHRGRRHERNLRLAMLQWRVSGRQISTLEPKCFNAYEEGVEVSSQNV